MLFEMGPDLYLPVTSIEECDWRSVKPIKEDC